MQANRFSLAAVIALAALTIVFAYFSYSWGIWTYLISVARAPAPSPNAAKTAAADLKAENARGPALLVHGLNFEADKLLPLAAVIRDRGYSVHVPRMAGHRGKVEETFKDPGDTWRTQFDEFNRAFGRPGVCAGYSMGGLMVVERFLAGRLACSHFLLFAPAFATYTPDLGARLLETLLPARFMVPSGIPGDYKHFDRLGLAPTWAVVRLVEEFRKRLPPAVQVPPGLVFLDPRDQVVNAAEIRRVVREYFPAWKLVDVEALPLDESHAFHMIIDETHVGAVQWAMITNEIASLLKQ